MDFQLAKRETFGLFFPFPFRDDYPIFQPGTALMKFKVQDYLLVCPAIHAIILHHGWLRMAA